MAPPVDEEGWSARDPAEIGTVYVLGDPSRASMTAQIKGELCDVQAELSGVMDEVRRGQCTLMIEQKVVHCPEGTLACGRFCGLGGELGVDVHIPQRKVAPHIPDVAEIGEQFAHDGLGLATVGALEVGVLDKGDGCVARTPDVVAIWVHRVSEVHDGFRRAQQRAGPQPQWECGGDSEQPPSQPGCTQSSCQNAELGFLQIASVEGQGGDKQAHGEANTGNGAAAGDRRPAHRWAQPANGHPADDP